MTAPEGSERGGKIVTFYSYKGGTGRSMALANVAWVLASSGKRVLAIDWDLEAPGLHRFFEPFLADKSLELSTGIIDFVRDFATASVAPESTKDSKSTADPGWYKEYADILAHAISIEWDFPAGGILHLVPAGRQDPVYAVRVNSFDWDAFYERLGGGILLERVKENLRGIYDFILIDSRTGVSDTSGICTLKMPDELVVCFTLNRQSIYGASSAARTAFRLRHSPSGDPMLKIWPVPCRVELFEKDRLEFASTLGRARFSGLMRQLSPEEEDKYWGEIPVPYEPYYAYEEVLAALRDPPRQTGSMLAHMETIAAYLNGGPLDRTEPIDEVKKVEGLAGFTTHSAHDFAQEFTWLGEAYESVRGSMDSGNTRTELLSLLLRRAQILGGQRDAAAMAEKLFNNGTESGRILGLALARTDPGRPQFELALSGIREMRSPFEQYHALQLAEAVLPSLGPNALAKLRSAIRDQLGKTIRESDSNRWNLAWRLEFIAQSRLSASEHHLWGHKMVELVRPSSEVRYNDISESHGAWVNTRGAHTLQLPRSMRIGRYLVPNSLYLKFVQSDGYKHDKFWTIDLNERQRFVTLDGRSMGPAAWPNSDTIPEGKDEHPVTSVSFHEAQAFVSWCNSLGGDNLDWMWSLPLEDHWEFAARSEQGFIYPWGNVFDSAKCNTSESGIGGTSEIAQCETGSSTAGCCDMAGNVWEFVLANDASARFCVLRGGSFKNDQFEARSHLRLFGVPVTHRAADFGIRLAQIEPSTSPG